MCGRFSLYEVSQVLNRFNVTADEPMKPRYNIAPGQMVPVIANDEPSRISYAKWGLIPTWSKDPNFGFKTINAKVETVAEKPSYKNAVKKHRCLVPADGFYEWKKTQDGKEPFRFELKNKELFAMAGIFEYWTDENGKKIRTFSIITMSANKIVSEVHHRMPVILTKEQERLWISEGAPIKLIEMITEPFADDMMQSYPISKMINSTQNEGSELIKPVTMSKIKSLLDF